MNYKTQGIIIKRRNFSEADRIITVLSRGFGKIELLAKGVRKTKSKLGGHLELFYLTNFLVAEGKNLDLITGAELVEDFPNIRTDRTRTNQIFYFAEILNCLVKDKEPIEEIFILFLNTLKFLDNSNNNLIQSYYILNIFSELGHLPETDHCVKCRKNLTDDLNYFSASLGGVICEECKNYDINRKKISKNIIKLIRIMSENSIGIIDKINVNDQMISEINDILNGFAEYVAERKFASQRFLK